MLISLLLVCIVLLIIVLGTLITAIITFKKFMNELFDGTPYDYEELEDYDLF